MCLQWKVSQSATGWEFPRLILLLPRWWSFSISGRDILHGIIVVNNNNMSTASITALNFSVLCNRQKSWPVGRTNCTHIMRSIWIQKCYLLFEFMYTCIILQVHRIAFSIHKMLRLRSIKILHKKLDTNRH